MRKLTLKRITGIAFAGPMLFLSGCGSSAVSPTTTSQSTAVPTTTPAAPLPRVYSVSCPGIDPATMKPSGLRFSPVQTATNTSPGSPGRRGRRQEPRGRARFT